MKIRQGFVSNSSSSSFVILCKGDLHKEVLTQLNTVSEKSMFYQHNLNLLGALLFLAEEQDYEDFVEEYDICDWKREFGVSLEEIKNEWRIYTGSAYDQDANPDILVLCNIAIDYKSENLIVKKQESY